MGAAQTQYVVSPVGSDSNPGTLAEPFKTLEAARNAIRTLKATSGLPSGGVEVLIRAGKYSRAKQFELKAEDSGEMGMPIVYKAYQNEEVILSAGIEVSSSLWKPLSNQARARVHPNVDPDLLVELDLSVLGDSAININKMHPTETKYGTGWHTLFLYVGNERQKISRWPDFDENLGIPELGSGWTSANGSINEYAFHYGSNGAPANNNYTNELELDGTDRPARLKRALDKGYDLWLTGRFRVPFQTENFQVKDIDTSVGSIELFDQPAGGMGHKYVSNQLPNGTRVGSGKEDYYFLNILEEISHPEEFSVDYKDQKLYYFPERNISTKETIVLGDRFDVINIRDARHISFIDIDIVGGLEDGIDAERCDFLGIYGCKIREVVGVGIKVNDFCTHITIQGNDIHNTGSTGLFQGMSAANPNMYNLMSHNNKITNNRISKCGFISSSFSMYVSGNCELELRHNLVHHTATGGIMYYGNVNSDISYNEVHNINFLGSDVGAFYSPERWETYGNELRYNLVAHGGNTFYLDDGESGDYIVNNIAYKTGNVFKFGGGHDNIAHRNILVDSIAKADDRGLSRGYTADSKWGNFVRGINPSSAPWDQFAIDLTSKYDLANPAYGMSLGRRLWLDKLDPAWEPQKPNGTRFTENILVGYSRIEAPTVHSKVHVSGSVGIPDVYDAGFYDEAAMDLRSNNALILEKFPNLNSIYPQIGLKVDEYRPVVPSRAETKGLSRSLMAEVFGAADASNYTAVDLSANLYNYDFGTETSPVREGWMKISPGIDGQINMTSSRLIQGGDVPGANDDSNVFRDYIYTTGRGYFNHKIENGTWRIALATGHASSPSNNFYLKAEGEVIASGVNTQSNEYKYITNGGATAGYNYFAVDVLDGELNLEFGGSGAVYVNRVQISRLSSHIDADIRSNEYRYDFGRITSTTEPGWKVISHSTTGADVYWSGNPVLAIDRGATASLNNINRDFVMSDQSGSTFFNHKIANGTWRISLVTGDASASHSGMMVSAEGVQRASNISTSAGEFKYVSTNGGAIDSPSYFDVVVTDGELNLELSAGNNGSWTLAQMTLTKMTQNLTVNKELFRYRYDLGAYASPTESGWTRISNHVYGDVHWAGNGLRVGSFPHSAAGDLNGDYLSSNQPVTFSHALANGLWRVYIVTGSASFAQSNMKVTAEDKLISRSISTLANQYRYVDEGGGSADRKYVEVLVDDGELNLEFSTSNNGPWAVTQIELERCLTCDHKSDITTAYYPYDFGTPDSPVRGGWVGVSHNTVGDIYWSGDRVYSADPPNSGSDNLGDFVYTDGTSQLNLKVMNGQWNVALGAGAQDRALSFSVNAEGQPIASNVSVNAGETKFIGANGNSFTSFTQFPVTVLDGELTIEINASSESVAAINRLQLTRIKDAHIVDLTLDNYMYDFGPSDSPVANEWTKISADTFGDVSWSEPHLLQSRDRGEGAIYNDVNRDFIVGAQNTIFNHKISNGKWAVQLTMNDRSVARYNMSVSAEGQLIADDIDAPLSRVTYVTTSGGGGSVASFNVEVVDGELNIEFSGIGASGGQWVANGLALTKIDSFDWTADADENNQPDGIDYFLGSTATNNIILPPVTRAVDGSYGWDITYDPAANAIWKIEVSADLITWNAYDATDDSGIIHLDRQASTIHVKFPSNLDSRMFFRLSIQQP